jgi:uncharacterized protein (TIGR02646 family)
MIYFAKTHPGPTQALLDQKASSDTSTNYDIAGVRSQLEDDFFDKCYICGIESTSMRIEHFRPHRGNRELMFDWNNLFYACEHCNSLKGDRFTELLDCTSTTKIDDLIKFDYDPAKGIREKVLVSDINAQSPDTVELIQLVFSARNTPTKKAGAKVLERKLSEALRDFQSIVTQYTDNPTPANEALVRHEVNNQSEFAAFKRWKVKSSPQNYPTQLTQWFVN